MESSDLSASPAPSRSARKRASAQVQKLGEELAKIKPEERQKLDLPSDLAEALAMHDRISSREGARRQRQYIGKIMRNLDTEEIARKLAAIKDVKLEQLARFKKAELAREKIMMAQDEELEALIADLATSAEQRAIIMELAKNARGSVSPGESTRAKKELFRLLAAIDA